MMNWKMILLVIAALLLVVFVAAYAVENWDPAQKAIDKLQDAAK